MASEKIIVNWQSWCIC